MTTPTGLSLTLPNTFSSAKLQRKAEEQAQSFMEEQRLKREALRRDRDALSPSLRRRLTWQQALCLAPLVDLPRLKQ